MGIPTIDKQTILSFLENDKFINWRLYRNKQLDDYWADYIEQNPEQSESLAKAIEIFKSIRLEKEKISDIDKRQLFRSIEEDVNKIRLYQRNHRLKTLFYYTVSAAACVILICCTYLFMKTKGDFKIPLAVPPRSNVIAQKIHNTKYNEPYGENDIRIIIGGDRNNAVVVKNKDKVQMSENGNLLLTNVYGKIRYIHLANLNSLIVPKGKHLNITLCDGTKVYLNSGTSITIPEKFLATRDVHLKGEAYFDVAHKENQPFIVHTSRYRVQVYGTKFNVMSYNNNRKSEVVLAQGKVAVNMGGKRFHLRPNEMFALNNNTTSVVPVDASDYTSWKDGILSFHHKSIHEIMDKISRYYGKDLVVNRSAVANLDSIKCTGCLYLTSLDKVLVSIYAIAKKHFSFDENRIYVE